MPSPFPGMDPYLEAPALWEGFRDRLIVVLSEHLLNQLQPKYWVNIEQRLYVDYESDPRVVRPDVAVARTKGTERPAVPSSRGAAPAATVVEEDLAVPMRETYLTILLREDWRVVTVVELLSPTNKRPNSIGRAEYLRKRSEVLQSDAHLLEIDLLRAGERVRVRPPLPPAEYYAFLHRRDDHPNIQVFPLGLRERLSILPLPLLPEDPDAMLDLQRAVETTYDRGAYHVPIRYADDPVPALSEGHRAWAREILGARAPRT